MTSRKFCLAVTLLFLLCLLPVSLQADTIYTYSGDTYNTCGGSYGSVSHCNQAYGMHITFDVKAGTPLDNLTISEGQLPGATGFGNITADVVSFSYTDGSGLNFNQSNSTYYAFNISTDSAGNIVAWSMDGCMSPPPYQVPGSAAAQACEGSYWFPSYPQVYDSTTWSDGSNGGNCFAFGAGAASGPCLGTWTQQDTSVPPAPVPEPGTLTLLGTGVFGVAGEVRRRWRRRKL